MSNPDADPAVAICESRNVEGAATELELIEPRDVPLGGIRAMNVRRTLPQKKRSLIGAWCFLDHYGPDDVAETGGMNVRAHPHIGLQTVSWLFSGEIEHRDSAGFHAFVRPGELNIMTAGRGISHSERSTPETTVLHGAQLWVALPERARMIDPGFEHYAPPIVKGDGWLGQVFLGELLGEISPVETHTPLLGAELRIDYASSVTFDIDPAFEHGLLVDSGEVTVHTDVADGVLVEKDHLVYAPPGARTFTVTAGEELARVLIIGGKPLGEQIVMWWNFIGTDHDIVAQARHDWQAELAAQGFGDPSDPTAKPDLGVAGVFGLPENEPEPPLPAPKLPSVRLLPRR